MAGHARDARWVRVVSGQTGWIAVASQVVGTPGDYDYAYDWDGTVQPTRDQAVSHGFELFGCDDFNVGEVRNGRLVWWGWMDHDLSQDIDGPAYALGLAS